MKQIQDSTRKTKGEPSHPVKTGKEVVSPEISGPYRGTIKEILDGFLGINW